MPKVTVRLTDQQRDELAEAAARNQRSLQNEIVHRCLGESELHALTSEGAVTVEDRQRHFKPDFGTKLKR